MILRQIIDRESWTYTYLVADEKNSQACLIDPVLEHTEAYLQLLKELDLKLVLALDTHVHADHITALGKLRQASGCQSIVGSEGDVACASQGLHDGLILPVGSLELQAIYTPGHTADSYSFYLKFQNQGFVFSGDTLFIRGTGRTDFQNGDPCQLYESLHKKLLTLPDQTIVYPGHDYKGFTSSTIAEEREHNPRLQIHPVSSFKEHMDGLNLPNPKMMDIAVPANQACGEAKEDAS